MLSRITAGKGLSPFNSMLLMKAIFNAILGYGTEMVPISSNCFGKSLINQLEIIQRRTIKALFDAPFCVLNEIAEFELNFLKIKHYL